MEQFNQAMALARLAAVHRMPRLSTRAVLLALAGGPPVPDRLSGLELLATVILLGPRVEPAARAVLEALAGARASRAASA